MERFPALLTHSALSPCPGALNSERRNGEPSRTQVTGAALLHFFIHKNFREYVPYPKYIGRIGGHCDNELRCLVADEAPTFLHGYFNAGGTIQGIFRVSVGRIIMREWLTPFIDVFMRSEIRKCS
jgi:hypothetical protein